MNKQDLRICHVALAIMIVLPVCSPSEAAQNRRNIPNEVIVNRATIEARPMWSITRSPRRTVTANLGGGISVPIELPEQFVATVRTTVQIPMTRSYYHRDRVHYDWIPGNDWEKAVTLSDKHERPILVMQRPSEEEMTTRQKRVAKKYKDFKAFQGFVRLTHEMGNSADSEIIEKTLERANGEFENDYLPRIVCIDTKGRLVGIIPYGMSPKKLVKMAKILDDRFKTLKRLDRQVLTADNFVKIGRFRTARNMYDGLEKQSPDQEYFRDLAAEKKKNIDKKGSELLAQANELFEEGKGYDALRMVQPIIVEGGDFKFVQDAVALRQRIKGKKD